MIGISWGGFNGLQVAARRPPALKAIVTLCSTDDRYADDVHYMGGAKLDAGFGWASFFFADMCHPPDPALVGDRWRAMWLDRLENAAAVPRDLAAAPAARRLLAARLGVRGLSARSSVRSTRSAAGPTATPTPFRACSNGSTVPRKGLIGPWAHAYPHFALPGPQIGFLQEMLRWWDHWLKGVDTGVMDEPMLRAWMTDSVQPATHHETLPGRWVAEASWPPPERTPRRLFLTDAGCATRARRLPRATLCSPQTVGRHGGEWCPFGRGHDQADDQREDDARSLVFETPPLDEPIEILGAPILTLEVASDKPVANLVVRLCDVHPIGRIAARQLRRPEPHPSRQPRDAVAAGAGRALPGAAKAQRCRRGVSRRPSHQAGALHDLLADGLARARDGDR